MIIGYRYMAIIPCNHSGKDKQVVSETPSTSADIQRQSELIKDKTGIVPAHLLRLQRAACELNCIIAIRPVDRLATELIEAGHPTKGFHIKGKSASWGGQAGFICVDQRFSKLENESDERIAKFNEQVRQCISDGDAVAVPLVVTQSRLQTLLYSGAIDQIPLENPDGILSLQARGLSDKSYAFEAKKLSGKGEVRYQIFHNGKSIEVLAPTINALPFTADYDLLMVAPHISDLGSQDNLPVPDVAHHVFRRRIDKYSKRPDAPEIRQDYDNPASFYRKEDGEIGNASERVRQMIPYLNEAVVGDGEKVIHHNVDSSSPASDPAANYPATFILPVRIGRFDELCVIENKDELREFVTEAKRHGYHMVMNPLWEPDLLQIRNPHFEEMRRELILKL
ncbi:CyaA/EF/ExoY family adenylyl cyclase toxin [Yersinia aldovae]|uniref:CyaA/EF/ExoY family adenylyl cyclase toxin n=1 Tax=Yersinia aldovae TaxID=29483 RepID=UPI0005AD5000|nr:CyaA/EF/ExoY family adenylyl cyclase toxin [Yersinia aldovae]AJJ62231.1 anthrax toxin LF subunit [Yersinia aldovae 670-83]